MFALSLPYTLQLARDTLLRQLSCIIQRPVNFSTLSIVLLDEVIMKQSCKLILIGIFLLVLPPSHVLAVDITVSLDCSLPNAILAANLDAAVDGCPAGYGADTIWLTGDVTLAAALPAIDSEVTIEGGGYTVDGIERFRIFTVILGGSLSIKDLQMTNGKATRIELTDFFFDRTFACICGGGATGRRGCGDHRQQRVLGQHGAACGWRDL